MRRRHERSRRARALLLGGLFLGGFWHASGQAAPGPREAWRRGLVLFKQKKFDAACELIASAANAEQTTAAIWADLGLCELKRGHTDAAVHASLLAARFGDERTRKNAYFNLNLTSHEVDLPGAACGPVSVAPETACPAPLFACTKDWQQYGSAEGDSGTLAVFDTDLEGARARNEDASLARETTQSALDLSESHSCFFTWCSSHGWDCDSSPLVEKRVETCYVKQHGPVPKGLCLQPSALYESFQKCSEDVCAQANAAIGGAPGSKRGPRSNANTNVARPRAWPIAEKAKRFRAAWSTSTRVSRVSAACVRFRI